MLCFLAVLLWLVVPDPARAQQAPSGIVAGRVVAAGSRAPIADALVRVIETAVAGRTDSTGRFVLRGVPVGIRRVEVRRLGFAPRVRPDVAVSAGRAAELEIALEPAPTAMQAVTVRPSYFPALPPPSSAVSTQTLTTEEIRRAPGVQEDVVRAVSVLPGVSVTNPVANDIVVRGGGPAENLFLVDDVEVQSINHFSSPGTTGGVLSVFPVSLVADATLSAGGFGVRYGDRTASSTSITLREGSRERASTQLTFAATGVGAIVEGPLGRRGSLIVGARRSYLDFLFAALDLPFVPSYTDLTTKVVFRPTTRDRLSFFFSGAVDRVKLVNESADDRYENARTVVPRQDSYFSGLGWQRTFARGVLTTTLGRTWARLRTTQQDSGSTMQAPQTVFAAEATEPETSLRTDLTLEAGERLSLELGNVAKYADALRYRGLLPGEFRTDAAGTPRPLDADTAFSAFRNATYVQATLRAAGPFRISAGVRTDYYGFLRDEVRVAPRGALTWITGEGSSVTLSGGRYWQAPPTAWLVGDPGNAGRLLPLRADVAVLGWQRTLRPDLKLQLEGYAKRYAEYPVRLFRPRAVLQPAGAADASVEVPLGLEPLASEGTGRAVGAELFLQKRLSETPWYGLVSLGVNRTRFTGLDGVESRGSYDLPFSMNALAGWRPNQRWELATRLRSGSGLPTTPYITTGPQAGALDYARWNDGGRLAPTFQLDVRVDRRWTLGGRGQLVTYLDVQGVNGRQNESYPIFDRRTGTVQRQRFVSFLPSIGVTWER